MLVQFDERGLCKHKQTIITQNNMSKMQKWSVPMIRDKQIIISPLGKVEKEKKIVLEFGITKQQISDFSYSLVEMLQHAQEMKICLMLYTMSSWLCKRCQTTDFIEMKTKVAMRKMMARGRNKFPIQRQQNISKNACRGWNNRTMLTQLPMMYFAMRSGHKTLKQTSVLHYFRNDECIFILNSIPV